MTAGALITGRADDPLIVLIHGLGGSHRTWDRVIPLIDPHARVHALNLAGSDSIENDADIAATLIPGPAVLVGHSRGGLVATAIAERHPTLVRRLILLCTPWAHDSRRSARGVVERALALPVIGQLLWAAATDGQRRRAASTAFAPHARIPGHVLADLRATGRRRLVAGSRAIDAYLAQAPLEQRLTASGVPAELVFGELDTRIAPPASTLRNVTLLPGVGHTPPWEAPDGVAELIRRSPR
jgi:pimeloyl-ACP methyl ester carboxylesterase